MDSIQEGTAGRSDLHSNVNLLSVHTLIASRVTILMTDAIVTGREILWMIKC